MNRFGEGLVAAFRGSLEWKGRPFVAMLYGFTFLALGALPFFRLSEEKLLVSISEILIGFSLLFLAGGYIRMSNSGKRKRRQEATRSSCRRF